MYRKGLTTTVVFLISLFSLFAQDQYELNAGWKCINTGKIAAGGEKISQPSWPLNDWLPATVPGTVLTTLINNKRMPDPFYGMNNNKIPDIYHVGRDYYTYWFVKDFTEAAPKGNHQVWLHFRGVNYSCDAFLNGHKLNSRTHRGMFLRQTYNITPFINKTGANRLAVIVYPPDAVGNPNGGQGGDGEIARNVSHQYVAGWDWIQPIRDRNTGIWDKVTIERTGPVNILHPHIITRVPGTRLPEVTSQAPATLIVSAELENATTRAVSGILKYTLKGASNTVAVPVTLPANTKREVRLPDHILANPRLWWPNGYGPQALYSMEMTFVDNAKVISDAQQLDFGVREITTTWNTTTRSRQAWVNGQPVFIKGGNWIISDELLRFSPERYDAEVRFHRDMNLNLIRVWGGALTERPEFYQACDKYGILVFQDFWNSGDCNGRWTDPMKKEDQWTRRQYPDDHSLFLASVADQVKMIRNHPSLAFWCGGNEITPPGDILRAMKDSVMPALDGTRYFFDYSNSDSMSYNFLGGNGDGPYGVQPIRTFWADRTFPFNSEVGSVGMGDYESLERFLPEENRVPPQYPGRRQDSVWEYHKYIGYDSTIYAYGPVKDLKDFAFKAQLVNYDQYRALMEGFSSHMWEWYTGSIIWKTQNPWTALRGQMYDYYLDVNACLYGLHSGSEPLHVMLDPVENMVMIVNNTFSFHRDMMLEVRAYDMAGKERTLTQVYEEIGPSAVRKYLPIGEVVHKMRKGKGAFLSLRLLDDHRQAISDNFYWLPDSAGQYSGLQEMGKAEVRIDAHAAGQGKVSVTLHNPAGGPVAFFNRLSLVDPVTKQRILPVFYSDNYVSVTPGERKTVTMEYTPVTGQAMPEVTVEGWNVDKRTVHVGD
ncbi:glycoside hydrolase family 2 TIM barrel-domain containing protein [Flavitalea sp. BT771]|uniref:glycoside hydrolase family 2 protein n=1 Tax=Flavitalea sp. BT771 TaxID=3063329 RepID=UPI0026E32426|nr:glycoside hydrolase family 2 TIM barrel-domain containing protein [Flavitalea sp. BT771]MDO6429274.1 glycoside hydrolase family 2 TIM barrel-domain containing protein [Flavitalea sp. BT771]MDV6218598.1 glycoside hydrolase family 2 TIM barrel-domain containing protein [Flavitalea sp. BT771]